MDRDFFLNAGLQFEPSSQPPWKINYQPDQSSADGISRPNADQYSRFESALSSMVSSPVSNSTVTNDIVAVRELVGKLGGVVSQAAPYNSSTNTYSTPSPPKLNLPIMDHFVKENLPRMRNSMANLPLLPEDPGFAERAAKFSCFGSRSFNSRINQLGLNSNSNNPEFQFASNVSPAVKFPRVSSSPALKIDRSPVGFEDNKNSGETNRNTKFGRLPGSAANSNEESSVSEQIPSKDSNSRKRKGGSTTKKEENESKTKRLKDENGENTKAAEAPKDYIHVRARRGQATDSHSLAERVRREKIGERMKLLQNLVPNCNKVTGKALMLDEIINYVQSLQRQVEFLSMKLATVNPSLDFEQDKNVNQSNGNLSQQQQQHPVRSPFFQQNPQLLFNGLGSAPITQSVHGFAESFPEFAGFGQDDLQSIVQMGFSVDTPFFHDQPSNMKMEL